MARQIYIIGNWKMHQSLASIQVFFKVLKAEQFKAQKAKAWIAPQSLHMTSCLPGAGEVGISVGAQNCSAAIQGAYTGEISAMALREMGAVFSLLGHSERRTLFGETDQLLGEKVQTALSQGLKVVFCVGETLQDRESGQTVAILEEQIVQGLAGIAPAVFPALASQLILAYEPIWAIGTGKAATPEMANAAHTAIRKILAEKLGWPGDDYSILYGGSVKPSNIEQLLFQEHIDGALVGGASLQASDFKCLVESADAACA